MPSKLALLILLIALVCTTTAARNLRDSEGASIDEEKTIIPDFTPGIGGIGQGTSGIGQGSSGVGEGTNGIGQGISGIGQGSSGVGEGTNGIGQGSSGIGQGSSGIGEGTNGTDQGTRISGILGVLGGLLSGVFRGFRRTVEGTIP